MGGTGLTRNPTKLEKEERVRRTRKEEMDDITGFLRMNPGLFLMPNQITCLNLSATIIKCMIVTVKLEFDVLLGLWDCSEPVCCVPRLGWVSSLVEITIMLLDSSEGVGPTYQPIKRWSQRLRSAQQMLSAHVCICMFYGTISQMTVSPWVNDIAQSLFEFLIAGKIQGMGRSRPNRCHVQPS